MQDDPTIDFYFEIENYQIELSISGDDKLTDANVDKLTIKDINLKLEFVIDYLTQTVRIARKAKETTPNVQVTDSKKELLEKIAQLRKDLEKFNKASKEGLRIISQINSLSKRLDEQDELIAQDTEEQAVDFEIGRAHV